MDYALPHPAYPVAAPDIKIDIQEDGRQMESPHELVRMNPFITVTYEMLPGTTRDSATITGVTFHPEDLINAQRYLRQEADGERFFPTPFGKIWLNAIGPEMIETFRSPQWRKRTDAEAIIQLSRWTKNCGLLGRTTANSPHLPLLELHLEEYSKDINIAPDAVRETATWGIFVADLTKKFEEVPGFVYIAGGVPRHVTFSNSSGPVTQPGGTFMGEP